MSEPTWRDDLDNLLATAGEAEWVDEIDERLTALLTERDSYALRLDESAKRIADLEAKAYAAGVAAGKERERANELHRRCQLAEGAVERKMKAEQAAGAPLAKRLAMAGYAAEQEKRLECERRLDEAFGLYMSLTDAHADLSDEDRLRLNQRLVDALQGRVVEKRTLNSGDDNAS